LTRADVDEHVLIALRSILGAVQQLVEDNKQLLEDNKQLLEDNKRLQVTVEEWRVESKHATNVDRLFNFK